MGRNGAVGTVGCINPLSVWITMGGADGFFGLVPQYDSTQHLAVPGEGPYFPGMVVMTWDMDAGEPNELWEMIFTTAPETAEACA
jgi:hypothetical protein